MQMGFNTDVDHAGVVVHVQTEDHGHNDGRITTQVFFSGRILDVKTVSYAEVIKDVDEETRKHEISRRMKALHKHFLNKVRDGVYDIQLPLDDDAEAVVEVEVLTDLSAWELPDAGEKSYRGYDEGDDSLAAALRQALNL